MVWEKTHLYSQCCLKFHCRYNNYDKDVFCVIDFFKKGYVVGLGDRHAQNILIDKSSSELIHIDLGVAFEQGKTLRTPEVVPFRLTRGIILK